MEKPILAPSLLAADFCDLGSAVVQIEAVPGSWIHFDVMDGVFVPNISFGIPVLESVRGKTKLPLDVHLMTVHPEYHIEAFAESGADYLTFHYEAAVHHHRIVQQIRAAGKKAGISIVPSTPVSSLLEILSDIDLVLVMTVNPGFGGQRMIEACLEKVRRLADIRRRMDYSWRISVDGGVNADNFDKVRAAGADVIVSGSAFFSGALAGNLG